MHRRRPCRPSSVHVHVPRATLRFLWTGVLAGLLTSLVWTVGSAAEASIAGRSVGDGGARAPSEVATVPAPPVPGTYAPPLDRPVRDPFRMEAGPYGAGNRGLEYASVPGDVARAIGAGRVVFAGAVAGRLAVTVQHPDGRRSSLTGLVALLVTEGDVVVRGQALGVAGERLHLGVREGERYVDPAALFDTTRRRAVLVR